MEHHIDGYHVVIGPHPEKAGHFGHTINGARYGGRAFKTHDKALIDAKKVVEIRKSVDSKSANRPSIDLQSHIASEFFKHAKHSGNPNS
jgi:hypothetical protein